MPVQAHMLTADRPTRAARTSVLKRGDLKSISVKFALALAAYVLVLFFFTPRFLLWKGLDVPLAQNTPEVNRAIFAVRQLHDPFKHIDNRNSSVLKWRLFFPVVGHLLHLPDALYLALPQLGCLVTLIYTQQIARRYFQVDLSVFCAGALAATASWFFISNDWLSYQDSWCVFGLLVVSFGRSRSALAMTCLIEPFIDERFVLMIPLTLAVRYAIERGTGDRPNRMIVEAGIALGSAALYIAMRIAVLAHDSVSTAYISNRASELHDSIAWTRYALGAWMGLRLLWLLVPAAIWLTFTKSGRLAGVLLLAAVGLSFVLALTVAADLSRSMGMLLPAALLGLFLLQRHFPQRMSVALPALLIGNLLLPASNVVTLFCESNHGVWTTIEDYRYPPPMLDAQSYLDGAQIELHQGKPTEALYLLDMSLRLNPNSPSALFYRALTQGKLNDSAASQANLRAAKKSSLARP